MKYLIYRAAERPDLRMGALAPWDPATVVDVHLAEVSSLETRMTPRRAHEIASHLVPAAPAEFFGAGATVWEFARRAVSALREGAHTARGERITTRLDACAVMPVLDHLLTTAGGVVIPSPGYSGTHRVAAVVHRYTYRVREDDAWDHVAAYIDLHRDPTRLLTTDELDEGNAEVFCSVAEMVATISGSVAMQPGDIVIPPAAEEQYSEPAGGAKVLATV